VLVDFLKAYARLSSPLTVCVLVVPVALWLWRRPGSRGARLYLTLLLAGYALAATPAGARALIAGLVPEVPRVFSRADAGGADIVVVLSGGATTANVGGRIAGILTPASLLRALEGARVFGAVGARLLVVSGGMPLPDRQQRPESAMLRETVIAAGVPPSAVVEETASRTTREQARAIRDLLRERGAAHFVLVTGQPHMRRSLAVFRACGLTPVPSAAPTRTEQPPSPPMWLPSDTSLALADESIYEYAALAYYWTRGWLRDPCQ
jgi:uncharacterized SAM-binding protein YcdF (DUF218 family)